MRKKNTEKVSSVCIAACVAVAFSVLLSHVCAGSIWLSCEQRNNSMSSSRYTYSSITVAWAYRNSVAFYVSLPFSLLDGIMQISFFSYLTLNHCRKMCLSSAIDIITVFDRLAQRMVYTVLCLYSVRRYEILLNKFGPAFLKRLRLQPKCPIIIKRKIPIN